MKIIGTFLDEISHDIPHHNWGIKEWDKDFEAMKAIGIEEVILIRCGNKRQITFPSETLINMGCYRPYSDLCEMFLTLADKHNLKFWFSTYDSGNYWMNGDYATEIDISKKVTEEAWKKYGHHKSFAGWYITNEVSKKITGIIDIFSDMGKHLKDLSGGLPVMISPYIDGRKSVDTYGGAISRNDSITVEEHYKQWDEIMAGIKGAVDIVAFQDGHVDFYELYDFLAANKEIADRNGIECRTNTETFDRDMPIKFMPIKWEKLWLKLCAAEKAGYEKAITFEFSHFMSPNSMYLSAGHLYNRYKEYINL